MGKAPVCITVKLLWSHCEDPLPRQWEKFCADLSSPRSRPCKEFIWELTEWGKWGREEKEANKGRAVKPPPPPRATRTQPHDWTLRHRVECASVTPLVGWWSWGIYPPTVVEGCFRGHYSLVVPACPMCSYSQKGKKKIPQAQVAGVGSKQRWNPKGLWRSAMILWSGPDLASQGDLPCCLLWLLAMPPVRFFFIHSPPWPHLKWQWGECHFGNMQIVSPSFCPCMFGTQELF